MLIIKMLTHEYLFLQIESLVASLPSEFRSPIETFEEFLPTSYSMLGANKIIFSSTNIFKYRKGSIYIFKKQSEAEYNFVQEKITSQGYVIPSPIFVLSATD